MFHFTDLASVERNHRQSYHATSRMLAMAALCLLRRDQCRIGSLFVCLCFFERDLSSHVVIGRDGGGVLTPASALGTAYFAYLAKVDVTFRMS